MRIGVDARLLSEEVSGIGRYTHEVLRHMAATEKHDWVLYSHCPIQVGHWQQPNVKLRTNHLRGRIPRMIWAQTVLPLMARQDGVDLFWSPAHRLPSALPISMAKVVTIHDLVWKHAGATMRPASRFLDSVMMPKAVAFADAVIAISNATRLDICAEWPSAADKVITVNNGRTDLPTPAAISFLQKIGIIKPYLLSLGTMEPRKNLRRLVAAFAALPQSLRANHQIVFAGGKGWGADTIEGLLAEYGVSDSAIVAGYVGDAQLMRLMSSACIYAMPSLYEGFGLPILEAMQAGAPVLTSNLSSMPEVAGDAAVLVDPFSVDSISSGIIKLLEDNQLRENQKTKGFAQAAKFSWQKAAKETLDVFDLAKLRSNQRRALVE